MSIASQATQQKFPFDYASVFNGLIEVIPQVGLQLKSHDNIIGRITASAGMSLFSWGENLTVIIEKIDDKNTLVAIESALKLGANLAGAHRHQKNFNAIIEALSRRLQRMPPVILDQQSKEKLAIENENQKKQNQQMERYGIGYQLSLDEVDFLKARGISI